MSIEATSGGYSPDTVYGNLTAPFVYESGKTGAFPVHINAHTPYDEEVEDQVVTQSDYRQLVQNGKVFKIEDFVNTEAVGFQSDVVYQGLAEPPKYEPPVTSVNSFSASSLSNANLVKMAIDHGYTADKAYTIAQAQKAYQTHIANVTAKPAETLQTYKFTAGS